MPTQRQSWLVIFNCQAMGLANCLSLLGSQITVEYHDPTSYEANKNLILPKLDQYDRVIVVPSVGKEIGGRPNVWRVPGFYFTGYHPDICFLSSLTLGVFGPLRNCHSIITYAGFRSGLNEKQVVSLYREDIYRDLGYFDHWAQARDALIGDYKSHGLNISQEFVEWTRKGPFMHISVHPKIFCLLGLAKVLLNRAALEINDAGTVPHDNLTNGPVFPVYPEIASRLGVQGSYSFKLGNRYEYMPLEEFVSRSFHIYRETADMTPFPQFATQVARAIAVLKK